LDTDTTTEKETTTDVNELTVENWERQEGESNRAYAAFCLYRDYGSDRKIFPVILSHVQDKAVAKIKYHSWRHWSAVHHWAKRAADFDKYIDKLRLAERLKLIEERGEAHRQITEQMLKVVKKKLDLMSPEELSPVNVTDWVRTAVQTEREVLGIGKVDGCDKQASNLQPEINFDIEFNGL